VNVCLLVGGKRADGYHDVATVMAPIALADALTVDVREGGRGIRVSCDGDGVPNGKRNIAGQAAAAFVAAAGVKAAVAIRVEKNVPVGAGLGGGSSDAAATLAALNEHFAKPLGRDALWTLARRLGSDVPFFLDGGWGFATGRGEFVTRVRGPARVPLLVAAPRRRVPTARVYQELAAGDYAANADAAWRVLAALDGPAPAWWAAGENSLARPAARAFRFLAELERALSDLGYGDARLSGSGGAFVAPADDDDRARAAAAELSAGGYWAVVTATG
jgi:4-diphosphocytidyl-2-C-methyl-D-erythritol kinase